MLQEKTPKMTLMENQLAHLKIQLSQALPVEILGRIMGLGTIMVESHGALGDVPASCHSCNPSNEKECHRVEEDLCLVEDRKCWNGISGRM